MNEAALMEGLWMPERIQRKRTKGWRMPENTVYVGRPTMWGNPFVDVLIGRLQDQPAVWHRNSWFGIAQPDGNAADYYRLWVTGELDYRRYLPSEDDIYSSTIRWGMSNDASRIRIALSELAGKNLACWCPLTSDCHADVLLEIANQ